MNYISLTPMDLVIAASLVIALATTSFCLRLRIGKQLLIVAVRATIQLLLIGLVLKALFSYSNPWLLTLIAMVMLAVASREVLARQKHKLHGGWGINVSITPLFISSFSVTLIALVVIIDNHPWYSPQYAIPFLGMLLGNTMSGVALSLDRLSDTVWREREIIEQRLLSGETASEALADIRRASIRAGMLPIINALATAGIVNLPGMMTGQLLAGSPPLEAVKYQILILFLIAASNGCGILIALSISSRRLFDTRQRLRIDRMN